MKKILLCCLCSIILQGSDCNNTPQGEKPNKTSSLLLESFRKHDPKFDEDVAQSDARVLASIAETQHMSMQERINQAAQNVKNALNANEHMFAMLCTGKLLSQLKQLPTIMEEEKKELMENGLKSLSDGEKKTILMFIK